ncbi:GNAT family N-acetyltransferase [Paraburkholderia sp. BL6665CI2N2]|uniref:GNAT family N-acetyltransferase n=1 Tax=Paraburkholderia sp. BL6665CI2N2 TaxID=1938806 RepID=UPI0010646D5C|nr:GNAT family N-acetyltransferase [Paraburkholderia sp. BL6665CI2N2]
MNKRKALLADAQGISIVAARTFALACPAGPPDIELQKYIDENLTPSSLRNALSDRNFDIHVLDEMGTVIGFSVVTPAPEALNLPLADGVPELMRCYVLPTHHGTGAAQRLLSASLAELHTRVRLTVNDQNTWAIRFYSRSGFSPVGETLFKCGDDIHRDLVMIRMPI